MHIKLLIFTIASAIVFLQLTAQTPSTPPSQYSLSTPINYVRVWEPVKPYTNVSEVIQAHRNTKEVRQTTQYFDGLGRPLQTVVKNGSLATGQTATDLVVPVIYDEFGREQYKYLPFSSTTSDGNFKTDPFQQQKTFYDVQLAGQGETFYYGQTKFESSPLNRTEESFAPGNSWVGTNTTANATNPNARKSVKMKYWINTVTDAVRIWNVTDVANNFGTYSTTSTYAAGELYKTIIVDEHGKQVIEFKDKDGKVILKKVQLTVAAETDASIGSNHNGWLCTYYIYDDLNNLRCVIQPRGVELLVAANWAAATLTTILSEQCFRYEYDHRNRMIIKKVPGAGEVYMVYDARDRLVMTQDANLRTANKWMVTLYDFLNRPKESGLLLNTWDAISKTAAQHRDAANMASIQSTGLGYPFTTTPSATYYEQLSITGYDDYTTIPAASGLTSSFDNTWAANFYSTYNATPYFAQQQIASSATRGMVTWSQTKVLGTALQYLYTVMIYDDKGRVIQVKAINNTGQQDVSTTQYSWNGQPLVMVQKHLVAGGATHTVVTKMEYDDLWRVKEVRKKINTGTELLIAENKYDKLGQLTSKNIGKKKDAAGNYSTTPIETLSFDYNIRGWLLGANRNYIKDAATNYFGFELAYDKTNNIISGQTYAAPQFNGNINGSTWKSAGDSEKRKFDYTYDAVNRLTGADFNQYTSSSFNKTAGLDFSVSNLTFDANGNILTMNQKGWKMGGSNFIDQMTYTYFTNTNKLQAVTDAITVDQKLGDFTDKNTTATDYGYDKNGNLVTDLNKQITGTTGVDLTTGGAITYNYLNLPFVITVAGKGNITYTYDAAGNKLKKVTIENPVTANGNKTITTTTSYINGFIYESKTTVPANTPNNDYTNRLQFTGHEEGRIRALYDVITTPNTITGFAYDYMLKDHLGNVRMVLSDEVKTNYYPAATLEGTFSTTTPEANSMVNWEKKFYRIDNTKITAETSIPSWGTTETTANGKLYSNHNNIPPGSPNPNYPAGVSPTQATNSTKLYKLNATSNKTGLEFMIKVMAGDKIDILGRSYYLNTTSITNANSSALDLLGLMTNLLLAPVNPIGSKGILASQLNSWNTGLVPNSFFRGSNNEPTTTVPKAYINYIFFDEQFKYAGGSFSRVGASGTVKDHWTIDGTVLQNINVPKNGYLFVYVSNESKFDVFFDNLQVVHKPGPILEETHYYPFGLTMQGISSKAANILDNKYEFGGKEKQEKEFSDGSGLEMYDFGARNYDPQIGRWNVVDPLTYETAFESPYSAMGNNTIKNIDPDGQSWEPINKEGKVVKIDDYENINGYRWVDYDTDEKGNKVARANTVETAFVFGEKGMTTLSSEDYKEHQSWQAYSEISTGDKRADANIASLDPRVQDQMKAVILELRLRYGIDVRGGFQGGYRTYAEQDEIFARGASRAKGGQSNHNFAIAMDVAIYEDGKYLTKGTEWQYTTYGKIAKEKRGLMWGGDWNSFFDPAHIEYKHNLTMKQLRALLKDKKGFLIILP